MSSFNLGNYFTYKDEVSRTISWGHWFLFLNIFLALVIGCCYLYDASKPSTGLGFFYLIISWLGHFSCLVFIFYLVLFFPLSFIGSLKCYRVLAVCLSVILFIVLLIDVKLYQSIKIHLNISVLGLFFEQEGFSTGLNFNFLYIVTPILIALELFFSQLAWKHIYLHNHQRLTYILSAIFLISFFSTHILHIWANAYKYVPITLQKSLFPAYYPMTANTFLAEHGWIVDKTDDQIERINTSEDNYQPKIKYPLETIKVIPKDRPFNVIIILINGISQSYVTNEYMPNLSDFSSKHDTYLNNFIGANDSSITSFELSFGLPGQYLPLMQSERFPPVFISEMLQQDYKIKAFVSGIPTKKAQEYAVVNGIRKSQIQSFNTDIETIEASQKWITSWSNRPQMTLISLNSAETLKQTNSTEKKFTPQLSFEDLQNGMFDLDKSKLLNRYYNCVYSLDNELASLLELFKTKNLLDNTVVFITSSQGFSLPGYVSNSGYNRESNHVPLIVSWPDTVIPAKITALTSSQDIAPTISKEVLGIQNNIDTYSTGANIRDLEDRDWILSGSNDEIHIISLKQTTVFDKHGNASIYGNSSEETNQPNMATLIKAIKILNKFKGK